MRNALNNNKPYPVEDYERDFDKAMRRDPLKSRNEKPGMFRTRREAAKAIVGYVCLLAALIYLMAYAVMWLWP